MRFSETLLLFSGLERIGKISGIRVVHFNLKRGRKEVANSFKSFTILRYLRMEHWLEKFRQFFLFYGGKYSSARYVPYTGYIKRDLAIK